LKTCRRGISNLIALIIGGVLIVLLLLPLLFSLEREILSMGIYESAYSNYYSEKDSEGLEFRFDLLGPTPVFKIVNTGSLPAKLIRAWILIDPDTNTLIPVSINVYLLPKQEYDLLNLLDQLRVVLGRDVSPDQVFSLVSSRGNEVLIRQNIISLNIVRTIYMIETPDFRPDRSLLYWNFSTLLNRISASYSLSDTSCGSIGYPSLDYLTYSGVRIYPTKLLFVKTYGGNIVTFSLSTGAGCQGYVFKQLVRIDPNVNTLKIFFRFIALLYSIYYSSRDYDYWRFTVEFRLVNKSYSYASTYTYVLPIYKNPFVLMTTGELASYVTIDVSDAPKDLTYDLYITIYINQDAGRIIYSKTGLDYLVFQGAILNT